MATFGAVKTAIARRLFDDSNTAVTDIEIGTAINEAIRKWKSQRFWFNATDADLTISEDDTELTLPDDFLIDIPRNAVTIQYNQETYRVQKYPPARFDALHRTNSPGRPLYYCNRDGSLEISPIPDQDYSGKIYYLRDYDDFATDGSADATTNGFLTEAQMLIQNEALANLHGEMRQDEKMEERYARRVQIEYNSLKARTNKLLRTGTLTIEQ